METQVIRITARSQFDKNITDGQLALLLHMQGVLDLNLNLETSYFALPGKWQGSTL
jgi:hypothetical protein